MEIYTVLDIKWLKCNLIEVRLYNGLVNINTTVEVIYGLNVIEAIVDHQDYPYGDFLSTL